MPMQYPHKLLCIFILWFICGTILSQSDCDLPSKIANLEETIPLLKNGDSLLHAYRALGFAYYYNYELKKCQEIFDQGSAILHKDEVSDSARIYYILDRHNAVDDDLNLDSLFQITSLSYTAEHPINSILYIQQAYNYAINGSDLYNDSLLLRAILNLQDHEAHYNYAALGADYRSIFYWRMKNYKKAIDILSNNAQQIEANLGSCNKILVRTLIRLGQRHVDNESSDTGLVHYFKAEQILLDYFNKSDDQLAQVKLKIGQAYIVKSEFKNAISYLLSAVEVCKLNVPENSQALGDIYNSLSSAYANLYLYDKAIDYNQLQIKTIEQIHDPVSTSLFAAYHNLGNRFWQLGDYVSSEKYLLKAEVICLELLGENHLYTAITFNSLGSLYQRLEKYTKAEDYFQKSLKIREKLYSKTHNRYANVLTNLGIMNRERKIFESSKKYLSEAIDIFANNNDQVSLANAQNALSHTLRLAKEYDRSINLLSDAKSIVAPDGDFYSIQDPLKYLDILKNQVITYYYSSVSTSDNELLQTAKRIADEAMELFWWQYDNSDRISDKSELMNSFKDIFDYASATYLELYKYQGKEEDLMTAINIIEDAKSVALAEAELKRIAIAKSSVPKHIIEELTEIRGGITILNARQLKAVKDNNLAPSNIDSLLSMKERLLQIETQIKSEYPDYEKALVSAGHFDIVQERHFLRDNIAYLELLLLEDRVIAFKVLNGQLSAMTYQLDDQLENLIFRFSKTNITPDTPMKDWENLLKYASPILSWAMIDCEGLVIIPDKQLSLLPFEIIPIKGRFAIEVMPISYANSLKTISNQAKIPQDNGAYTFTGFAPQYDESKIDTNMHVQYAAIVRSGMWELPSSKIEVTEIQKHVSGEIYIGAKAKKEQFLDRLGKRSLLHLSMHAILDERSPINSRFVFNSDGLREDEDLYLYEISDRQSNASMAVLSACETGRGQVHNGDGVKSFSNALIQAGIPSVVMSLWKVPDKSTSDIMISFYKYLKIGLAKDEALQKAKLDYLDNTISEVQRHPFYWAGFVIIGDVSPVHFAEQNLIIYWGSGILVLGLLFFAIRRIAAPGVIPTP